MEKLKNINPGAVIRLGLLAASFVNMALNLGGHSPLSGGSTLSHIAAVAARCWNPRARFRRPGMI